MAEHLPDGFPTDYIPDQTCHCPIYPGPHTHNTLYGTATGPLYSTSTSVAREPEALAFDRAASRMALAQLEAQMPQRKPDTALVAVLSWCLDHVGQLMGVALLIALFCLALAFR